MRQKYLNIIPMKIFNKYDKKKKKLLPNIPYICECGETARTYYTNYV